MRSAVRRRTRRDSFSPRPHDLTGYAGAKSLADLSLADNAEGNAVIGFGENTITPIGVSAASLDRSHFLLTA